MQWATKSSTHHSLVATHPGQSRLWLGKLEIVQHRTINHHRLFPKEAIFFLSGASYMSVIIRIQKGLWECEMAPETKLSDKLG